jgi:hypothetical protein
MLSRVLAALGVGVWCLLLFLAAVAFIIDRGLADVGIVWLGFLGIGVVAPVLLMRQINRGIATHEDSRRGGRLRAQSVLYLPRRRHDRPRQPFAGVLTEA